MFGQATANTEDHIGLTQEVIYGPGHDPTPSPEGQRMVFWKRTFPFQGGHHGYLQQLGQFHQFGTGLSVQHSLPGVEHRLACLQQHLGGFGNVLRVASGAGRFDHFIGLDERLIDIREGDIRGDFDHHRAWPPHLEQIEGTSHHFRDLVRLVERLDPLGDRVIRTR